MLGDVDQDPCRFVQGRLRGVPFRQHLSTRNDVSEHGPLDHCQFDSVSLNRTHGCKRHRWHSLPKKQLTTERREDFGWSALYEVVRRKDETRKHLRDRLRNLVRNLRAVTSIVCRTILVHREKLIVLRVHVNVCLPDRGVLSRKLFPRVPVT